MGVNLIEGFGYVVLTGLFVIGMAVPQMFVRSGTDRDVMAMKRLLREQPKWPPRLIKLGSVCGLLAAVVMIAAFHLTHDSLWPVLIPFPFLLVPYFAMASKLEGIIEARRKRREERERNDPRRKPREN